jgi:geranylgeranyl diphosphate synthase type II
MDVDAYFRICRERVEDALLAALPPEGRRPARLTEAIRYSVTVGGKRIRPLLCLAAAEAAGGAWTGAVPAAVAVEFLHTYTLVHDDLPCMDNDLLRRGMPTVHAKFGEAMGVLCGDALQACAFEALTVGSAAVSSRVVRWVRELALAAGPGGVVGGQVEDVADSAAADAATVAFVHQHKTADLFRAALRMGAIGGDADEARVEQLGRFGNHLGLAFQIVDDLLDDPRPGAADAPRTVSELSCLNLWSPAEARCHAERHTKDAIGALTGLPGPTEPLRHLAERLATRLT